MYPYGNPNPRLNAGSSSSNAFHGISYYGQVPNQQMQQQHYPSPQKQQQNNHGGQMNFPSQFQNLAAQPRQSLPLPQQQNSAEDKQKRYKLEQQRKFKNFGKSFTNTSIDSMLSNIVGASEKSKSVTENVIKKEEHDDFGDFLGATPTPQAAPAPLIPPAAVAFSSTTASPPVRQIKPVSDDSNQNISKTHPHHSTSVNLKPEIDLQTKMMSSLDMNQSQHAYMKFKPVTVHHGRRPENKPHQPSNKAANWSSLASVENAFVVERPAEVPVTATPPQASLPKQQSTTMSSWASDLANAPLLYKHVHEASIAADGLTDTAKLYPILLQCNLPKQTLGELWAIANQTIPGRLKQNELFSLLALIALTQNGQKNLNMESVLNLPAAPIPYMTAYQSSETSKPVQQKELAPPSSAIANHSNVSKEEDNFDDFQEFQSVPSLPPPMVDPLKQPFSVVPPPTFDNSSSTSKEIISPPVQSSPLPSIENKTLGTSTNSNHSLPVSRLDLAHKQRTNNATLITDDWSDFKAVEKAEVPSVLKPSSTVNQSDKYAAFSGLSQEVDPFQGFKTTTPSSESTSQAKSYPNFEPPAYSSIFQRDTTTEHEKSNSASIACKEDDPSYSDFSDFSNFVSSTSKDNSVEKQDFKLSVIEDHFYNKKNPLFSGFESFSDFTPSTSKETGLLPTDYAVTSASNASTENDLPKLDVKFSSEDVLAWPTFNHSAITGRKPGGSNPTSFQRSVNDSPLTIKNSLFKDVLSNSVAGNDTSSIKSDTNSVKSLELHSLSHTISQQSLGMVNPGTGVQPLPSSTSASASAPRKRYGPSFCDDDYNDFAEPPPDLPPDSFGEFDACEEGNSTLNDFDAFASFELPKKNQDQHKTSSLVVTASESSLKQSVDNDDEMLPVSPISFPVTPVISDSTLVENDNKVHDGGSKADTVLHYNHVEEEDVTTNEKIVEAEDAKNETVSNSLPLQSAGSKYENIEFSSDDWQITPTHSDQTELYTEKWEKCLSAGNEIIAKANQILGSIQSPDLCNEVVYSVKGQRFISDLSEVHAVAQRLSCSIRKLNMRSESLQHFHKQIELAWYNLLAFCPNTTIAEPVTDPSNEDGVCAICLTGLNTISISYAGSDYHATCANFWVNCVESVLPALQLPAEKTR